MKTLYSKFILTTILTMVGSLMIGFLITNTYYHRVVKEQNDAKNVAIAERITAYIESTKNLDMKNYFETLGHIGYQIYVVQENGKDYFYGGSYRVTELSQDVVEKVLAGEVYHGMRDYPNQTFVTGFFSNELSNTIGVPFHYEGKNYGLFIRPDIKLLFSEVHVILGGMMLSMAVISLVAMFFVAKALIRPITQLTDATHRIAHENFDTMLTINRADELGQLAASFNRMTEQLQENDIIRKEFISNVSHDFQSPLLNIQGYVELLQQRDMKEAERLEYSKIIEHEAKRMSTMTEQLLLMTSLDRSTRAMKREVFSLDEQLKDTIRKYQWQLEEQSIYLSYQLEPVQLNGDAALLENVWDNLLTNAIKYNQPDGNIRLTLEKLDQSAKVTVKDTGIGMTEEEISQIYNRFYRADASRTKPGSGLGMSIVQQIVDLHGGTIQVSSEVGKGTTILIYLPICNKKFT